MVNDRSKGNLGVNIGEGLLERINALAFLRDKSLAQLVRDILEAEAKPNDKEIAMILKARRKVTNR